MRKMFIGTVILASFLLASPVRAEGTAKLFLKEIDGFNESLAQLYTMLLDAIGTGIQWSNAAAASEGGRRIYCAPAKLSFPVGQKVSILRRFVADNPSMADKPVGLVLVMAFQDTFPCDSDS